MTGYRRLDAPKVTATIERLHQRAHERFPDASLPALIADLAKVSRDSAARVLLLQQPNLWFRLLAIAVLAFVAIGTEEFVRNTDLRFRPRDWTELVQMLEGALAVVVIVGTGIVSFLTLERRMKRARALAVLHELRSMAHIVDMHQLTKDPPHLRGPDTNSSPQRWLTSFELGRYLDYCSETLSLISKVAALYSEHFADPIVLNTVNEIEVLCTGLSRKIWQKMMMIGDRPA